MSVFAVISTRFFLHMKEKGSIYRTIKHKCVFDFEKKITAAEGVLPLVFIFEIKFLKF